MDIMLNLCPGHQGSRLPLFRKSGSPLKSQVKGKPPLSPFRRGLPLSYWLGRTPPSGHLHLFLGGYLSASSLCPDLSKPLVRRSRSFQPVTSMSISCPAGRACYGMVGLARRGLSSPSILGPQKRPGYDPIRRLPGSPARSSGKEANRHG